MYIYIYYESQPLNKYIYMCVYYKVRGLGTYTGEKPVGEKCDKAVREKVSG